VGDGGVVCVGLGVRGEEDLCSLELARRLLSPAQRRLKLGTFVLGQIASIAYIHLSLLVGDPVESTDESNVWQAQNPFHAQAGPIPGLHRRLHARPSAAPPRTRDEVLACLVAHDCAVPSYSRRLSNSPE